MKTFRLTYLTSEACVTAFVTDDVIGNSLAGYLHIFVEHVLDCLAFVTFLQQEGRELPTALSNGRSLASMTRRLNHTLAVLTALDSSARLADRLQKRLDNGFLLKPKLYTHFGVMSWEDVLRAIAPV